MKPKAKKGLWPFYLLIAAAFIMFGCILSESPIRIFVLAAIVMACMIFTIFYGAKACTKASQGDYTKSRK